MKFAVVTGMYNSQYQPIEAHFEESGNMLCLLRTRVGVMLIPSEFASLDEVKMRIGSSKVVDVLESSEPEIRLILSA